MCAMVDDNRAEGYRHANGAIPSAVVLSRQFEPSGNPGRPMTVEGMVSRASKAGFRNSAVSAKGMRVVGNSAG